MHNLKNKKILFINQRNWAFKIGHYLCKRLQDEKAILGCVTFRKDVDQFIKKQSDVNYKIIINHDEVINDPSLYLGEDDYSLEEICSYYNIKSVWPLAQSMRNFVKSYRKKFFYSYSQNVTDEFIVLYIKALHKFILQIEDKFAPDLIISPNFVSMPHLLINKFAQKRKIKIFAVTTIGINNMLMFTSDYTDSTGEFFDKLNKPEPLNENIYNRSNDFLNDLRIQWNNTEEFEKKINFEFEHREKKPTSDYANRVNSFANFARKIKKIIIHLKRYILGQNINYNKHLGYTLDDYNPLYAVRDLASELWNIYKTKKINYYDLGKIKKFAFMPLQFQPEANIDVVSPQFNNQIETARRIAMNLPGDLTLVVKDHPDMHGLRSYKYLEKILNLPNVKLIDSSINSIEVLKKSKYLISVAGSIFFEAAVLKIPSLLLGNLGTVEILPNVLKINSLDELSDKLLKINDIIRKKIENNSYDEELKKIIYSDFTVGFDINFMKIWETGYSNTEDLNEIYKLFYNEAIRLIQQ